MKPGLLSLVLLSVLACVGSADPGVKRIDGKLPTADMKALGSGSGVIVSSKYVLTNRHVAQNDDGVPYGGFKVYAGPKFETPFPARLVAICEEYDLALLETALPLETNSKLTVLDGIPPLGLRVTAFGFPLGSEFGIGLTATGGQVSRHPVTQSTSDSDEHAQIKRAVWHDAVLSSGNSGGPLFSEDSVLVGINFAKLSVEDKHALAVPGNVVSQFIRLSGVANGVLFGEPEEKPKEAVDPRLRTVFVEVWGDADAQTQLNDDIAGSLKSVIEDTKAEIKQRLSELDEDVLEAARDDEPHLLLPEQRSADISSGTIARIKGNMLVIQVLDDGLLVEIDGVRCAILLNQGGGAEFGAKVGNAPIVDVPIDAVFLVGEAKPYTTRIGTTQHAVLLAPATALIAQQEFKQLVESEIARRNVMREEASRVAEKQKRIKAEQRYLEKLRHTFRNASGKFSIDAIAVLVQEDSVEMMRMSDGKRLVVPLSKIHEDDRQWLKDNRSWIKVLGPQYVKLMDDSN